MKLKQLLNEQVDPSWVKDISELVSDDIYRVEPEDEDDYYNILDATGFGTSVAPKINELLNQIPEHLRPEYMDLLYDEIIPSMLEKYFNE